MKDTIISMLLENTGKHPMDSGGESGRRWQRNQFRDFESEEPISFEVNINYNADGTVRYRDIIPTISLYHWLMAPTSRRTSEPRSSMPSSTKPTLGVKTLLSPRSNAIRS